VNGERAGAARWIDIREGNELDEAQMANWVKQAAALPAPAGGAHEAAGVPCASCWRID
jgi:hypothetical protein